MNIKKTEELIESAHCKILILPPYSPDFNPIEKGWANLKRIIRNIHTLNGNLIASIEIALNTIQPIQTLL